MKRLKIISTLLLALVIVFSTSGCWNYVDINELFVVEGFAVDKDLETGEYILVYEIAKAKSGSDTELAKKVAISKGETLYEAIRDAIHSVGSKLYWGHVSVGIIGKNAAQEGILPIMDTISRSTEIKPSVFLAYSNVEKLEDLFNLEDPIHDTITDHIGDLFEESTSSGKFITAPMIEVVKHISGQSPAYLLPNFILEEELKAEDKEQEKEKGKEEGKKEGEGEKELTVNGSAIFKDDKFIGMLDDIETRSVNIMKNLIKKHYVVSLSNTAFPHASIEILDSKVKFDAILENKQPRMKIELDISGRLTEVNVSKDLSLQNIEYGIISSFEELLVHQLGSIIHRAQKTDKVDYIGFGQYFFTKYPDYWDAKQSNWNHIFESMNYDIKVNIDILNRGSIREPLEIGQ